MTDETAAAMDDPSAAPAPEAGAETDRVAELEAKLAEARDQLLRTLADMENLRSRTQREVKDAAQYAIANFARSMLTVSDNLHRALSAVPESTRAGADEALRALLDGLDLTEREMLNQLERAGVRRIRPEGERFDPNFHQAMFEVPNPDMPAGTIVQVVQDGYTIADRVLRPAMVGVTKGGPRPAAPAVSGEAGPRVDRTV